MLQRGNADRVAPAASLFAQKVYGSSFVISSCYLNCINSLKFKIISCFCRKSDPVGITTLEHGNEKTVQLHKWTV
jgi:hypothetical protein